MQMDADMAQGSRQECSSVSTPAFTRTKSLALAQANKGRTGTRGGTSVPFMVLLRRNKDKRQMGKDDEARNDRGGGAVLPEPSGNGDTYKVFTGPWITLEHSEKLSIYRRRNKYSQTFMADLMGVHRNTYGRLERGENTVTNLQIPSVLPLYQHEACFIYRRRSETTQQHCADTMGVTRYWYNLMETGAANSDTLMEFWNEG